MVEACPILMSRLDLRGECGEGRKVAGRSFSMVSGVHCALRVQASKKQTNKKTHRL